MIYIENLSELESKHRVGIKETFTLITNAGTFANCPHVHFMYPCCSSNNVHHTGTRILKSILSDLPLSRTFSVHVFDIMFHISLHYFKQSSSLHIDWRKSLL